MTIHPVQYYDLSIHVFLLLYKAPRSLTASDSAAQALANKLSFPTTFTFNVTALNKFFLSSLHLLEMARHAFLNSNIS